MTGQFGVLTRIDPISDMSNTFHQSSSGMDLSRQYAAISFSSSFFCSMNCVIFSFMVMPLVCKFFWLSRVPSST